MFIINPTKLVLYLILIIIIVNNNIKPICYWMHCLFIWIWTGAQKDGSETKLHSGVTVTQLLTSRYSG
jgi:hypothetical protein